MPAFRINALRLPIGLLLLLLLFHSLPVACKTNDALLSSAGNDNLLLGDSESLSVSSNKTTKSICLEIPDGDFFFTAIRSSSSSCLNKEPSVIFWFGDHDCEMYFKWSSKNLYLEGAVGSVVSGMAGSSKIISFKGGKVSFIDDSGEPHPVPACLVKEEKKEDGKRVVCFSAKGMWDFKCAVKVLFPRDYKRYEEPAEPTAQASTLMSSSTEMPPSTSVSSSTLSPTKSSEIAKASNKADGEGKPTEGSESGAGGSWWIWVAVGVPLLLLVLVIGGVLLCFFCVIRPKKKEQQSGQQNVVIAEQAIPSGKAVQSVVPITSPSKSRGMEDTPKNEKPSRHKHDAQKSFDQVPTPRGYIPPEK